jgi:hypothetical protein
VSARAAKGAEPRMCRLSAEIKRRWERDVDDTRSMRDDQREGMTAWGIWCLRLVAMAQSGMEIRDVEPQADGTTRIRRTHPQIRAGVQRVQHELVHAGQFSQCVLWQSKGSTKLDSEYYAHLNNRMIRYFTRIGWIVDKETILRPNGEAEGIVIVVASAAPVAQLDRATKSARRLKRTRGERLKLTGRRGGRGSQRSFFSPDQVVGPVGIPPASVESAVLSGYSTAGARGARTYTRARQPADEGLLRGQELATLRRRAAIEGGFAALVEAAREGVDPLAVAIAGWELTTPRHPALTRLGRRRLKRYCTIADRHGGVGVGLWALLGDLERHADQIAGGEIVSLEYFTWRLRATVIAARRDARRQRKDAESAATWDRVGASIGRWQAELRERHA